jgi:hypothetical protein
MMKINQIFCADNFSEPRKMDWVSQEANYLLKIMEADPNFALAERFGRNISPASLERFFRRRERSEKTCQIMQYLLAFLGRIPSADDLRRQPVNPAEQFRDFLRFEADLLLEEDVKNAVFEETNHQDHFHAGSVWDIQENILTMNRRLKNMLAKDDANLAARISGLCRVLEHLCQFWFDVRRHDIRRTRRSDIFMFLLAQLVRSRCWQVDVPGPQ